MRSRRRSRAAAVPVYAERCSCRFRTDFCKALPVPFIGFDSSPALLFGR